jgi:hypothetical protein
MNGEERARILRLVADGIVSPVEAEDLLSALEPVARTETRATLAASTPRYSSSAPALDSTAARRPLTRRNLVLRVEGGDSKVNLRIPLGLARTASRFLPRQAQEALASYSIDLDRILENLTTGSEEGTLLEVQNGDEHVLIAVE